MYTPSFLEIFVGLVVVILWARWLRDRPAPQALVAALPWVAGAAVLVGQVLALWGLVQASTGQVMDAPVRWGRWGSFGVVAGCVLVELGLTAWSFVAKRSSPA